MTEPASTPEEQYLAEAFRFDYITDMQEAILARTNASLITGLSMYLEGLAEGRPARAAGRDLREIAGGQPRTAPVEPVYAAAARTAQGHRGSRGLRPADPRPAGGVPVALAAVQDPPDARHSHLPGHPSRAGQGPGQHRAHRPAHRPRRPPAAHCAAPPSPLLPRREPEPWREEALARLKSVNAQSVRAYQVIELPRTPQDPPEGTLHLALGPHSHHGSWWDHAATYLSNAIEEADRHGDLDDSSWKSIFTG